MYARLPIKRTIAFAVLVALLVWRRWPIDDRARFDHRVGVVRSIVDGNRLDVHVDGTIVRVRLLGIDAVASAADYFRARALNKSITLRLDETGSTRDSAGDVLAYIYLDDAEILNQSMIRDGVAFAYRTLDCDLRASLETEENGARAARRGLWKTITPEEMPAWRRQWMREHHLE